MKQMKGTGAEGRGDENKTENMKDVEEVRMCVWCGVNPPPPAFDCNQLLCTGSGMLVALLLVHT